MRKKRVHTSLIRLVRGARSFCALSPQLLARAQRYSSALPLAWPRAITRTIIARSHAQRRAARARGARPAAPAPLHCAGHAHAQQLRLNCAGRARARANPVAARRRSISRHSSRACTRPPAFLRRLHPETSRHRTREPRDHAAPSARRITTRRRVAGGVRQTGGRRTAGRRPADRGSSSASVRGAISAQVPPCSPSRHALRSTRPAATRDQMRSRIHALHSTRTPSANRAHHNGRTAGH